MSTIIWSTLEVVIHCIHDACCFFYLVNALPFNLGKRENFALTTLTKIVKVADQTKNLTLQFASKIILVYSIS